MTDTPLPDAATRGYLARFRRVLEHIDAHLDGDLSVERLSAVAAFSKFHFHRQFSLLMGIGAFRYVQLVRLKRASYELAFRAQRRIIDIALSTGYESHEAFSRAFKKALGQTPSEFREHPDWASWHASHRPLQQIRSLFMKPEHQPAAVRIVVVPPTRVAVYEHRGDPSQIGNSVRRFIEWRRQSGLHPKSSATFNILYDNPMDTPPERYRLDLCAATERDIAENTYGIVEKTIPGGRCAVLRHVGSDDTLGDAFLYLYATWLPASGEELRDYPLYLQRIRFFPDVPEHEAESDIFLPIA